MYAVCDIKVASLSVLNSNSLPPPPPQKKKKKKRKKKERKRNQPTVHPYMYIYQISDSLVIRMFTVNT